MRRAAFAEAVCVTSQVRSLHSQISASDKHASAEERAFLKSLHAMAREQRQLERENVEIAETLSARRAVRAARARA
eukprot:6182514-Pleurochrysis_carterae.AAC.1